MNGMPKVKVQQHMKVNNVVNEFFAEFSKTSINELFCKLCECEFHAQKSSSWTSTAKRLFQKPRGSQIFLTEFCCQSHRSVLIR